MREILVAYPSKDTALKLRSLLEGEGYDVPYVCATGCKRVEYRSGYERRRYSLRRRSKGYDGG